MAEKRQVVDASIGSDVLNTSENNSTVENPMNVSSTEMDTFELESPVSDCPNSPQYGTPDMWSMDYIGLYAQYAAVGLLYGTSGAVVPFCVYAYDGATNICSNAKNIMFFAWSLKIFFAMLTDVVHPFGYKRKFWMNLGWFCVLVLLFVLAVSAHTMSLPSWLGTIMAMQFFLMLSDVPADGYSVELGQLERPEVRGQILATGQLVRFCFSIFAGVIQTFFLNGRQTNAEDCNISFGECWEFGLSVNGYYGVIFCCILLLYIPIYRLKELEGGQASVPFKHFISEVWVTLQNLTTLYLMIFVIGTVGLTNLTNIVNVYLQFYIIELTNFEAGIDTITSYMALAGAVYLFKTYLIRRNWRYTQYGSSIGTGILSLAWISAYYNSSGTMNAWYTIFIDLDQQFAQGLSQVLYSMAVIELAKPGLEATTYELIVTVGNAALMINGIIATQLLDPLKVVGCDDDGGNCPSDSVDLSSVQAYRDTNGPERYTIYTLVLLAINIGATLIFVPFLPSSREECQSWKAMGEQMGTSVLRGKFTFGLSVAIIVVSVLCICIFIIISDLSKYLFAGNYSMELLQQFCYLILILPV